MAELPARGKNRRRSLRRPPKNRVRVTCPRGGLDLGPNLALSVVDLCEAGIRLVVKEALEQSGYREAAPGEAADLCVVNTCTVTAEGDAKSRQTVRRLHQANPGAAIVVMGCYATRAPDQVGRLPGVARVITDKKTPLGTLQISRSAVPVFDARGQFAGYR